MVLYLFDLDLEEECQKMQESNKNLFEGLPYHIEENILARVVMILTVIEHMMIRGPLKEEGTNVRMGGHQIEEIIKIEDILGEGIQIKVGDPLDEEDLLIIEDS